MGNKDKETLKALHNNPPNPEENLESCSQKELESKLIEIHKFQSEIDTIKDKYSRELQKDDEERIQIREDHRASRPK